MGMNGGFRSHLSEGQGHLDEVVVVEMAEMRDTKIQDTFWWCGRMCLWAGLALTSKRQ